MLVPTPTSPSGPELMRLVIAGGGDPVVGADRDRVPESEDTAGAPYLAAAVDLIGGEEAFPVLFTRLSSLW
jgi:hypothetical protein